MPETNNNQPTESFSESLESYTDSSEKMAYLQSEVGRQALKAEIEAGSTAEDIQVVFNVFQEVDFKTGMLVLGTAVMSWLSGGFDFAEQKISNSWDKIRQIPNKAERLKQAAILAVNEDMNCSTDDGNHCSGWVDSVFSKAGLDTLYKDSKRVYVSPLHKHWSPRGKLDGLELKPGDAITYYNGNQFSGLHAGVVIEGGKVDSNGNYKVKLASQNESYGKNNSAGGRRSVQVGTIPAKNMRVVVRV